VAKIYRKSISNTMNIRMRYLARFSLNPGVGGTSAIQLLRPDSIHDPDATGVGHQPWGHDQITPLYTRYRVTACKMSFKFTHAAAASTCIVGATIRRNGTTSSDITDYIEGGPYTKYRYTTADTIAHFSMTYRPRILHGKAFGPDDFTTIGANPSNSGAYCHVWAAPSGSDTSDKTLSYVDVLMDFWVQLSEAAPVGQS